jgi:GcrA cell cycle regulator
MAWTEQMVEDLRQMWLEGLTANEIAKKLGVSKNSIVGKVHRLCLTARPSPIKKKEELKPETVAEILPETSQENLPEVEQEDISHNADVYASKPVDIQGVKLVNLDSHTCRWPLGDPRDEDFCFCGKKVRAGQTYCDEHAAMAYVKAGIKR